MTLQLDINLARQWVNTTTDGNQNLNLDLLNLTFYFSCIIFSIWQVLLYDEPTAGLDPIASTVVEDLIRSVHSIGEKKFGNIASYVVVTHQHSTIRRAVDRYFIPNTELSGEYSIVSTRQLTKGIFINRLLFLYEGRIIWQGMTHEFTTTTNPIVRQVTCVTSHVDHH